MKNKYSPENTVIAAMIAATYVALTYLSNLFSLAYGPIQLRISEALTVLPVLTPNAVWGLSVGCFIANIGSFNPLDMIFGTAATLVSALFTRFFRNIKVFSIPIFSFLMPVIVNAAVIGAEISFFFVGEGGFAGGFLLSSLYVAAGQAAVCLGLGIPLYFILKRYPNILNCD